MNPAEELAAELYEVGMRQLGARYTFGALAAHQREAWLAVARHVMTKQACALREKEELHAQELGELYSENATLRKGAP